MLNYIWAGLIIFSLLFALWQDGQDIRRGTYRNGQPLPAVIKPPGDAEWPSEITEMKVKVIIGAENYQTHFGTKQSPADSYDAVLTRLDKGMQARFAKDASLPQPLETIRDETNEDKVLIARVAEFDPITPTAASVTLLFEPVRFVKLKAITTAAFEFSKTAVTLALGLIGVLALWMGLMKIAEASGLIAVFVTIVRPILHPLFPQVPRDHPALGMIGLNLAANMLGLGNAATPLGLKAMEELQKLNTTEDTATDPMVMLLAINTAGVQLVPPATLIALMGLGVAEVFVPILLVTAMGTGIAILSVKVLGKLARYRLTNPNLNLKPLAGAGGN